MEESVTTFQKRKITVRLLQGIFPDYMIEFVTEATTFAVSGRKCAVYAYFDCEL